MTNLNIETMHTLEIDKEILLEIKDAVWELKTTRSLITIKTVFNQANGKISFDSLPEIGKYLESIKEKFLWTRCNGYLELRPFDNVTLKDYVSKV